MNATQRKIIVIAGGVLLAVNVGLNLLLWGKLDRTERQLTPSAARASPSTSPSRTSWGTVWTASPTRFPPARAFCPTGTHRSIWAGTISLRQRWL